MGLFDVFKGASSGAGAATEPPAPVVGPPRVATADVSVRLAFIRKVYALLTINFAITIGMSAAFVTIDPIEQFVLKRGWIILPALVVAFVFLLILTCVRPKFPFDIICMYAFVLSLSVFIGFIVVRYYANGAGPIVIQAFVATAAVFLSITAYVSITKRDFNFLYGFLSAAMVVLLVLILSTWVIRWFTPSGKISRTLSFVISVFGYVFFCFFLFFFLPVFGGI